MAWGYWSATTVSDRGRSPRRGQTNTVSPGVPASLSAEDRGGGGTGPTTVSTLTAATAFMNVNSNNNTTMGATGVASCVPGGANMGTSSSTVVYQHQLPPLEFEVGPSFSRRPSLDLGHMGVAGGGGPQGSMTVVLCGAHGGGGRDGRASGTMSAGSTLTRAGSRHAASQAAAANAEYAVPHHFLHATQHHHAAVTAAAAAAAYSEYHHGGGGVPEYYPSLQHPHHHHHHHHGHGHEGHPQPLTPSDEDDDEDEDDSEPGYATGTTSPPPPAPLYATIDGTTTGLDLIPGS